MRASVQILDELYITVHYAMLYFFFFQAEDGIRDYKVTGVQTCALPILRGHHGVLHQVEALERRLGHAAGRLAALYAALDDLSRMNGLLVVLLRVLFAPPPPARSDLLVLGEPPQRLLGDLLRHAFHRVVGRRHRRAERRAAAHLGQIGVKFLHFRVHRLGHLDPLFRDVKPISHGAPHGVVSLLDADVVPEERLAVLRRAVQQHLQPLGKVTDDRVEAHQEVLDLAVDQLVLRRVHDHTRIQDSLATGIQRSIQVGHPSGVGGYLHGHRSSFRARGLKETGLARGSKCSTPLPLHKFMRPWNLCDGRRDRCERWYDLLTRYIVTVYLDVTSHIREETMARQSGWDGFAFGFGPRAFFWGGPRGRRRQWFESGDMKYVILKRSEEHTSELQSPCNLVCRL